MSGDEQEREKPFAVEYAKTGRAKCKKCKCPIDKAAVRIAKLIANPFGEGTMKAWHHVSCLFEIFAKQRVTTKRIDDPEQDISGWDDLSADDQKALLDRIDQFEKDVPNKAGNAKSPRKETTETKPKASTKKERNGSKAKATPKKETDERKRSPYKAPGPAKGRKTIKNVPVDEVPSTSTALDVSPSNEVRDSSTRNKSTKDDAFREFRRLCASVADADAYTEKTAIIKKLLTEGTSGDGFTSDIVLWCKLLLPGVVKRVYNLQSKQLIKLFARVLCQDEADMLEDLEQGDVAETIRVFFENSSVVRPSSKSILTIQEVDCFLEELSRLTKEEEQMQHFQSIFDRCTGNDLKMIIRLIKHDLRMNAGAKHVLDAVHEDAYRAFQASRNLDSVIQRCLGISIPSKDPSKESKDSTASGKVALSLMTPVLPMLAEVCTSVEMAMKKCPNGMLSEVKYDGERVQVHKRGDEFRYFSRSLKPVLAHKVNLFKEYIPKAFPGGDDLILDSEVLMIDNHTGQPLPFGSLGVHKKAEFKDANVCLFVFDCIYYNGDVLIDKTMQQRRKILKKNMVEIPNRILLSEVEEVYTPQDLAGMIAKVLKMGLEGLVLKDMSSRYEPGRRHWLKVKKDYLFGGAMADTADLVVLGAWYGTGNKGGLMSIFLMGCYDEQRDIWLTVTKVHTGHDDATLTMLQSELDMVKISKDPSKVPGWLRANKPMIPDFVARDPKKQPVWEITGAEFTNQGVHTADGISIRFPRVTRIRHDKHWDNATSLNELRALFKKSSESIDLSLLLKTENRETSDVESKKVQSLDKFLKQSGEFSDKKISPDLKKRKRNPELNSDDELNVKTKVKIEDRTTYIKTEDDVQPSTSYAVPKWNMHPPEIKDELYDTEVKKELREPENCGLSNVDIDTEFEDEKRATYYSFVDTDYIEYSDAGSPLNWIEDRKPPKGLPADAKLLSSKTNSETKGKCILKDVRVSLAHNFKRKKRKDIWRALKTLGATVLPQEKRSKSTHVVHDTKEILSTSLKEYWDISKNARHVHVSWVEASAAARKMQDVEQHAVELAADYCDCTCRAR